MMMMYGFELSPVFIWLIGAVIVFALGAVFVRWRHGRHSQRRELSANRPSDDGKTSEADIYRLAHKFSGYLTVSDVVIHLGFTPREAEHLLENMTDGLRVRMEVKDNGLIVYEFAEVIDSPR